MNGVYGRGDLSMDTLAESIGRVSRLAVEEQSTRLQNCGYESIQGRAVRISSGVCDKSARIGEDTDGSIAGDRT